MEQRAGLTQKKTRKDTLRLARMFSAPRERVFRAWTDPSAITQWWVPMEGFSVPHADVDLRVGGTYRVTMKSPGGEIAHLVGTYREVRVPERLVYSWMWEGMLADFGEALVTVEFRDLGNSTEVVLTHELFASQQARNFHSFRWSGFDQLDLGGGRGDQRAPWH